MFVPPAVAGELARQYHRDLIDRAERYRVVQGIRIRRTRPAKRGR